MFANFLSLSILYMFASISGAKAETDFEKEKGDEILI